MQFNTSRQGGPKTALLRLSEHPFSQKWLAQFRTSEDRAQAAQLLNQLKLVSAREFETGIEQALTKLQTSLQATIAVYPVAPPLSDEIAGYDPFTGGIPKDENSQSREIGRRRSFGSEDRVGHVLTKLQERFKRGTGASDIECQPTLRQLKTQGIQHVVLVDDVCGSGKRITNYWKAIPRRIKSLLSLKRCELWIVLYAITPTGKGVLRMAMPNFPLSDHLITVLPEADLQRLLTPELRTLCTNYAELIGMESSGFGYRGSACPVVFEHGCPNNLPVILWGKKRNWTGLFPNRTIPTEMRPCFDEDGTVRALETLWRTNQPKLALSMLDALDHAVPLAAEQRMLLTMLGLLLPEGDRRTRLVERMLLTMLGLLLRGVPEAELAVRLLMIDFESKELLERSVEMGLYDKTAARVTPMGKEFVSRFRNRFGHARGPHAVGTNPDSYYPQQCEGKLRELGKTDRGNGRSVPVEPQ